MATGSGNINSPALKTPIAVTDKPLHDLVYQFKVSRRASPPEFRNLWQLIVKTPNDSQPMELVDADLLSTVIDKIRLVFEQDGL